MPSIHDIVDQINHEISGLFTAEKLRNSELYGIAVTALKGSEVLPVLMDKNGEGKDISIDDRFPVRVYHKLNSFQTREDTKSSMGRRGGDIVNTYGLSMVIFLNRKRACLLADELLLFIQANFPEYLGVKPYKTVRAAFRDALLNDQQVYRQEYQAERYPLLPEHNLFLINYQVETTHQKDCFIKCP